MIELKREIGEKEFQSKENMARLEEVVTNREEQLESLRVSLETQSKQAEDAIDEFKAEVTKCRALYNSLTKDIFKLFH